MTNFKISAPSRIVLCGEHIAMYGKCVVMAGLDLRTTLKFCELIDDSSNIIKIRFPDVDLSLDVPLEIVLNFLSDENFQEMISNHIRLLRIVKYLITMKQMWCTYNQRFSLQTFFFLLFIIAYDEKLKIKPFHVHVSAELPISPGLGSSSSFAVCLAACFLHWARLQKGAHDEFDENDLNKICHYAMTCEEVMQDYMDRMDNIVCTFGKAVKFRYSNQVDSYDIRTMNLPTIKILLIDSNICQNKLERANQMAELIHSYPEFVNSILNIFDEISKGFCRTISAITSFDENPNILQIQENLYAGLQIIVQVNQYLLYQLNMSHPRVDTICLTAQQCGFGGKLTGFGGGFVYILLPPSIPEERITDLSTKLMAEGFNIMTTSVTCSGVRIDD